jgi:hypothetical protein
MVNPYCCSVAEQLMRHCYDTCNTMYNRRIIQSMPAIFSFKSRTMDVVITVKKVRASNAGRRSGVSNMYWSHIWWVNHAVKRGVDCNERWLYTALIIHCVGCSVAESFILYNLSSKWFCNTSHQLTTISLTWLKKFGFRSFSLPSPCIQTCKLCHPVPLTDCSREWKLHVTGGGKKIV